MLLVTTADKRGWVQGKKTLFLGEWCKLYSDKGTWQSMEHEVVPYHWDDREKLFRDYCYLRELYEKVLGDLSKNLNKLHAEDYSLRYWRIILGPWLTYFIGIAFDRYAGLVKAQSAFDIENTIILAKSADAAPQDFPEFSSVLHTDSWNYYLFSRIIELLGSIPFTQIGGNEKIEGKNAHLESERLKRWVKDKIKLSLYYGQTTLTGKSTDTFFCDSYFPDTHFKELCAALNVSSAKFPVAPPFAKPNPVDLTARTELLPGGYEDEFSKILCALVVEQMPKIYLEGYEQGVSAARARFPRKAKKIVTANAYAGNEPFKFWAAERCEEGSKLYIIQHGGNIGAAKWEQLEEHQIKIADTFFSWGWTGDPKVKPISAPKLLGLDTLTTAEPRNTILLVVGSLPRYAYRMFAAPVASQYEAYLNELEQFLKALSPEVRRQTKAIFAPDSFQWDLVKRFTDKGLGDVFASSKDFRSELARAKICVSTFNTTTMLESMAADVPTLLFWNPVHWELRESAAAHYAALKRTQVLFESGQAAGDQLNRVAADAARWWNESDRQATKVEFVSKFASLHSAWLSEWVAELS